MVIDAERIKKMEILVENAKKSKVIVPSKKAFEVYPPRRYLEKRRKWHSYS